MKKIFLVAAVLGMARCATRRDLVAQKQETNALAREISEKYV